MWLVIMKCPVCNSKKYKKTEYGSYCYNCNYDHQDIHAPNLSCDIHNNGFRFKIIKDNPNVHFKIVNGMRGWKPEILKTKDFSIRRTKSYVEFYYRKRIKCTLKDSKEILKQLKKQFISEASLFSNKYSIQLDLSPIPLKNRPEIKLPEIISAKNFHNSKMKAVYPKPSPLETHGSDAVESAITLSNNLLTKDLANHIDHRFNQFGEINTKLLETDQKFSKNLELHLATLQNINKSMDKWAIAVGKLVNILTFPSKIINKILRRLKNGKKE